jgi:hypothetical protein
MLRLEQGIAEEAWVRDHRGEVFYLLPFTAEYVRVVDLDGSWKCQSHVLA